MVGQDGSFRLLTSCVSSPVVHPVPPPGRRDEWRPTGTTSITPLPSSPQGKQPGRRWSLAAADNRFYPTTNCIYRF